MKIQLSGYTIYVQLEEPEDFGQGEIWFKTHESLGHTVLDELKKGAEELLEELDEVEVE